MFVGTIETSNYTLNAYGNTAEAVVAAVLFVNVAKAGPALKRVAEVLALTVLAAGFAEAVTGDGTADASATLTPVVTGSVCPACPTCPEGGTLRRGGTLRGTP